MILGLSPPDTGEVVLGVNTRPAYLEQGRSELRDELTVLEEVGDGYDFVELPDGKVHVRGFLRMLAFPDSVADTKVGQLSGGERNRVQLARLLRRGGNLLVLDEPTNDLDLPTLGALEDGLVHFPGCALIVSHDRWFLDRVVTAILAFEGDGKVTLYEGSYSFYAERRPRPIAERARREARDTRPSAPTRIFSCGVFAVIWDFVQVLWMKRIEPQTKAFPYFIAYVILSFINGGISARASALMLHGGPHHTSPVSILISIVVFVLVILYRFSMRDSLERQFHSLAGIAGTYGFPGLTELARHGELRCAEGAALAELRGVVEAIAESAAATVSEPQRA